MAPTATAIATAITTSQHHYNNTNNNTTTTTANRPPPASFARSLRSSKLTASTPDLGASYLSHSRLAPPGLSRKTSLAALTSSTLASIPDVSESYALDSVLSVSDPDSSIMSPVTPSRQSFHDVAVGSAVDVPGGMHGVVRFLGPVQGKKGIFAGIELHSSFASRGKNSGDVDGLTYFTTSTPGAGIFVPVAKISCRASPSASASTAQPMTPTSHVSAGLKNGGGTALSFTPPNPGFSKLSASVGPGARASSPQGKRPRTSLPRPDSPVRRTQMTPGPRPSLGNPTKTAPRYGSPTNRLAQSVRGTAGDPSKKQLRPERKPSLGPRSISALGSASAFDDETTPSTFQRAKTNGSVGSVSSFSLKLQRSPSRATTANTDEIERLRSQLEEKDRQLKEQGTALSEMESSLVELQSLIEHSDGPKPEQVSAQDNDVMQLRHLLREKNDRIASLTAEFDAHRADFRSTIDTLEMASTETERVYERQIEELRNDMRELESRNLDVDSVASQLKQLEELVQELEEGLEDARRGEAEARGEAEFLRGEVERTRSELRREREKSGKDTDETGNSAAAAASRELEQKEDEIRGLKTIIHSLSREAMPESGTDSRPSALRSLTHSGTGETWSGKSTRDQMEHKVAELQAALEKKSLREGELELELEMLRGGSHSTQGSSVLAHHSSQRDSRDTVVPMGSNYSRSPDTTHRRTKTLDTMPESDTVSTATESSTLWCEICETGGHDILTCTKMFGSEDAKSAIETPSVKGVDRRQGLKPRVAGVAHPAPLAPARAKTPVPTKAPAIKVLPNPMESGPVAGKESGIMDPEKWCAVCERDGHDSVDCPFEEAF
ncbi:hypothetical protein CDD81_1691 [Ophiocordyceps australis]|uniref:CAP-Gly domain-containing protein n=1 Tax=Ophiocordyceps australis TaxID=1399860 RepID=A0A2C5XYE2_9HYPO|nr:hypothetical protein CDD81_1691 [Ophiocordyceps australis]